MVAATFKALESLLSPKFIAARRSKDVSEIIKKRNLALNLISGNE
jgi:ribosomal protein S5